MNPIFLKPAPEDAGKRVDVFLAEQMENTSRSAAALLLQKGAVSAGGKPLAKSDRVGPEQEISVLLPEPVSSAVLSADIPLDIVYEDEALLVINKGKGMVVHPGAGHQSDTLVSALMHHCAGRLSGINGVLRPGIVHRLDKDTTGLLVAAKNDQAHLGLSAQLQARTMRREYEAVVFGAPKTASGTVSLPIGRHPKERTKMAVNAQGRPATTHFSTLAVFSGHGVTYAHLTLRLDTGRTHQIRVHLAHTGHPVAGDTLYGTPARDKRFFPFLESQCLHACRLSFTHPVTGQPMTFTSQLPEEFARVLTKLQTFGILNTIE